MDAEILRCRICGSLHVTRHLVTSRGPSQSVLAVLACDDCREYWVDGEESPLTPERLQRLGLLP